MSEFEPSPRSSKRRKVTRHGAGSVGTKESPSTAHSTSQSVTRISRRLFNSRDSQDELAQGIQSANIDHPANWSKDDSPDEGDTAKATTTHLAGGRTGDSESADELAQSEVTVTPTKSQRSSQRQRQSRPKTAETTIRTLNGVEKAEETFPGTRSSGRERKRPRRFSSSYDDTSKPTLPKGILTPSRKSNKSPRKSVAFEREEAGIEDDLGFKDLDRTAKKKTEKRRKEPYHSNEAQAQIGQREIQTSIRTADEEEKSEPQIEDEIVPVVPEFPQVLTTSATSLSSLPADSRLDPVKSLVLSRLTGQNLTPLISHEAEYGKLHSLLSATINAGEGNSILLLGSRGVGKTCLVETTIADLAMQHNKEFHVVRLNGFLQTDDKLALREIWRQLGREMQVDEDETAQVSTYADTMASLLHLLSHPEELAESLEPDAPARTAKSVIFVLDEFDLFTTHPRQTLLYNLFDITQARKAPIAVIGCSARVDVSDTLEKRVKSRFSHRWIHLSQAKSLAAFEEIARAVLMLREDEKHHKKQSISNKIRNDWNAFIEVCWPRKNEEVTSKLTLRNGRKPFFPLLTYKNS
jgi:origin recognition complex subunit 4